MSDFVEIATKDELTDDSMKMATVEGHEILLAQVENNYYCADNRCPHMGGNLSQGTLEGTVVTCPRHHSQFDITDGHVIRWTDWSGIKLTLAKIFKSPRPLRTHEVKIDGEKILVQIE